MLRASEYDSLYEQAMEQQNAIHTWLAVSEVWLAVSEVGFGEYGKRQTTSALRSIYRTVTCSLRSRDRL
jgi:hypothetical protein